MIPDLDDKFIKFRRHMLVYDGLATTSADNLARVARKILTDLGTAAPTIEQVEIYIESLRESDYSWSHICNQMLAIERYMRFIGQQVKFGRPRKPRRVVSNTLTEAEVAILIDAARGSRERALMAMLAYAVPRNQELCDLRVRHVDIANHEVYIEDGKGARDRIAYIPGECARIQAEYIHDHRLTADMMLFKPTRGGEPKMRPHVVRRTVARIAARTKIEKKIYPHIFRHSWATNMLNRGANPRTIQAQLGHSFLETTMLYLENRPRHVKNECQMFAPAYM